MRVISQDGTMDFPYEISTIFIYPRIENVIAIQSAGDSEILIIGRYSSKEKAIKAMEMCRKHYATAEYNRRIIPKGDTLVDMEIAKELLASGFIFQFPQDDEIEV